MSKKKIVVAMSGGVDSTLAVNLLQEQGYEVIGATLKLLPDYTDTKGEKPYHDISSSVTALAQKLGIEHHFIDVRDDFMAQVLKPCWSILCKGLTPNPCALCNPRIKFGKLLAFVNEVGAEALATGHYAQIRTLENGDVALFRGIDDAKDQTYFLFGLSQSQLRQIRMPLGELVKRDVKAKASDLGFENANQKESQDACFSSPNEPFGETLRHLFNSSSKKGFFIDPEGKRRGRTEGIHAYTIGQRKGLGVALGVPAYVSRIDAETGDVYLATDEAQLMSTHLWAKSVTWQSSESPVFPLKCQAQVRYRSRPIEVTVYEVDDGIRVDFDTPQRAITPGQGVVFYDGQRLLGGGWIS